MSENEKQWEKAAQILVVVLLICLALRIGVFVGAYQETKHKAAAFDSLSHALEVIDDVDASDASYEVCEAFDSVMDDIHDAIAWMEKKP